MSVTDILISLLVAGPSAGSGTVVVTGTTANVVTVGSVVTRLIPMAMRFII